MAASTQKLQEGTVLDGTYELIGEIGSGGMGTVWQARHLRLPKPVAIKVLRETIDASSEAFLRFRREAEIASQLGHPHIVEALDFNTLPDGSPYLVLEYLRGESLRQRIRSAPLPLELTAQLVRQVASALHAVHGQGVVHRDLKPENIFLCHAEGEELPHAKVLDFGISKIQTARTELTVEGTIFGTPHYMAPEQAAARPAGPAADQFALATIAYEMLCGKTAFSGDQAMQVLYQVVNESPPPLAKRAPHLPAAVVEIVQRGMSKDPAERFHDVTDFSRQLAAAAGVAIPTPPAGMASEAFAATRPPGDAQYAATAPAGIAPGTPPPEYAATLPSPPGLPAPARSGPARVIIVTAVVAAGLLGGIALFWATRGTSPPATPQTHADARPDLRVPRPDLRSVPDLAAPADQRPRTPPRRNEARRPRPASVKPELLQHIRRAEALLAHGDLEATRLLGERLQRDLDADRWVGFAILARLHCVQQRLDAIKAALRNIPRRHQGAVIAYCRKTYPGFTP